LQTEPLTEPRESHDAIPHQPPVVKGVAVSRHRSDVLYLLLRVGLFKVKDGETVEVTEHGHLVALLVPVPRTGTAIDDLVEQGRVHPPTVTSRSLPARRRAPGRSAAEELIAMRGEERY
jgi:antitoxin (DNA-binding transcriptional repressor) of toxin-antitoxin stability system